jgi:phospholipid/cholesterol/gamma-HCH transport system permease protein
MALPEKPGISLRIDEQGHPSIAVHGNWRDSPAPSARKWLKEYGPKIGPGAVILSGKKVEDWDGRLVAFLFRIQQILAGRGTVLRFRHLPNGVGELLRLAATGPAVEPVPPPEERDRREDEISGFAFIAAIVSALGRLCRRRAYLHRADYGLLFRQTGVDALPIVALIAFLTGIILGFVGVVQLARMGAAIYVADLVGLAMAREMAPLMTGIVLAGRTGAAFAAAIGTMRSSGEVDALQVFGFSSAEFLVLPRMLATACALPLLTVFATFIGIGGGMAVALPMFHFSAAQYLVETLSAILPGDFLFGVAKGFIFALLISGLSCWHGLRADRNAAGVGRATTTAVVSSIIALVFADAVCALLGNFFHI